MENTVTVTPRSGFVKCQSASFLKAARSSSELVHCRAIEYVQESVSVVFLRLENALFWQQQPGELCEIPHAASENPQYGDRTTAVL
jgi:hypothetical protein